MSSMTCASFSVVVLIFIGLRTLKMTSVLLVMTTCIYHIKKQISECMHK